VATLLEKLGFQDLVEDALTVKRQTRAMTMPQFVLAKALGCYVGLSPVPFAFPRAGADVHRNPGCAAIAAAMHLLALLETHPDVEVGFRSWSPRFKKRGIGCGNHLTPTHLQPFYRKAFEFRRGDFPITEHVSERTVALPFLNRLSEWEVECVCSTLREVLASLRRTSVAGSTPATEKSEAHTAAAR
jgi:hypothetical protein